MAKFYVQSGNVRTIISAEDAERAALWVVHCTMRQVVPVYEDEELTPEEKCQRSQHGGMRVLGQTIHVSEVGFDQPLEVEQAPAAEELHSVQQFDTFDLLVHWNQLMVALARLEQIVH